MVMAACIAVAAVITMAGPAGAVTTMAGAAVAVTTMAGAAVAAIAITGNSLGGRDTRPPSAGRSSALGQRTQRNSALPQGIACRTYRKASPFAEALPGLALQDCYAFLRRILQVWKRFRAIDMPPPRDQVAHRLLDETVGIELQKFANPLKFSVVPGIQFD